MQEFDHRPLLHDEDSACLDGCRRRNAEGLAGQGALPKEIPGTHHCHDGFLSRPRQDRELYAAVLDVQHGVARVALREDHIRWLVGNLTPRVPHGMEKSFQIECGRSHALLAHPQIKYVTKDLCRIEHESAWRLPMLDA